MKTFFVMLAAFVFCYEVASAQTSGNIGSQATEAPLGCSVTKLTPSQTKTLDANQLRQFAVVSTTYYAAPCWRATVDFLIAPRDPGIDSLYQDFFFDSISSELIDTQGKCVRYRQETAIWMENNGKWTLQAFGRLRGLWSGSKCTFKPPPRKSDFRAKKYSPDPQQQTHFRLASVVTTGKGYVQPAQPTEPAGVPIAFAKARAVCFSVEHPNPRNLPIEGCADPTR